MTEEEKKAAEEKAAKEAAEAAAKAEVQAKTETPPPTVQVPPVPAEVLESPAAKQARLRQESEQRAKEAEARLQAEQQRAKEQESELAKLRKLIEEQQRIQYAQEQAIYRERLQAYRNQVISAYGGRIIAAMVVPVTENNTPTAEAIQASAAEAAAEYERQFAAFTARMKEEQAKSQPAGTPVPSVSVSTPAPVAAPAAPSASAFPTPPPAVTPAAGTVPQVADLQQYLTPESIRNGTFAQNRQAIHALIRGQSPAPVIPPLQPPTVQTQRPPAMTTHAGPGGVMVPQAAPTPPVAHPGVPPQAPPPPSVQAQGQAQTEYGQALAAIDRGRSGTLPPHVANDPRNQGASSYAQANLQGTAGQDAQAAFARRYQS